MTSTSFNPIQLQQSTIEQSQPLALKQGQVFHGTIKKLYPDQMAEIQVGQNKLFAKLETPLKAGDSHFFQVTNMNPQAELKVVTGPMQNSQTTVVQLNQLLETMNLPKTVEMQQLIGHFVKNQIPLSKETLLQAENWLKSLPDSITKQEALQVIQKMAELKLPFTNEVFKGLIFGGKHSGMSTSISHLMTLLTNDTSIDSQTRSTILHQLQMISKPFGQEIAGTMLSKAVHSLLGNSETAVSKSEILNLLKSADIVPKNATAENWLSQSFKQHQNLSNAATTQPARQHLQTAMPSKPSDSPQVGQLLQAVLASRFSNPQPVIQQVQTWIGEQPNLTQEQKAQLLQLVSRFDGLPKNPATIEMFAKQMHEQLVKAFSTQTHQQQSSTGQVNTSQNEHLLSLLKPEAANSQAAQSTLLNLVRAAGESSASTVQTLLQQADAEVLSALDGKMMKQAITTVLKGLGMSYEAALNSRMSDIQELAQSLKPQLLTLIQDSQIPSTVREAADNILGRLNGMQLTSGENGHQHQLIMQIPLQFLGKKTEATLQWNGRMKENGKIDANYARVLFYLDMEALEETMVDMQVQNRIITIHLYNNQPHLEVLAEPLKATLKKGLSEKNYQLSGLFVKPFEENGAPHNAAKLKSDEYKLKSGVDIRI
ncbi:hypothetical protein [Ureibacillus sinduriensis]|uniref:Flagellar hook-length control protein-like C-terminal domain-containing protein n=1 Tax=Ureibacillus sinduriensis BLB-1 = JCM 15800 TaxID=1384057 RepID=A0A0A3IGA7_9BACL|nr:hypothetical protein [Ureibacillus sinduriensis]KGR73877.1 hypothetical protein CD33_17860 [Ureibacillus sinduriensis BLB-1 = JCM 15800]